MNKILAILNFVIIIAVISWNYAANAIGINGNTVGSLSDEYFNLFTPAGYAFSIWGLIFIGLLALGVYHIKKVFFDKTGYEYVAQISVLLMLTNICNGLWIWFWLKEYTGITVLLMLTMLGLLIAIIIKANMERWDAPFSTIAFVWWPICLYSGWISVATIANIAAYLSKLGWNVGLNEVQWTTIMIIVAVLLNLFMIYKRNMREFALVGVWALIAIAVRHWEEIASLQYSALIGAIILFIYISIHAYQNRATLPGNNLVSKLFKE